MAENNQNGSNIQRKVSVACEWNEMIARRSKIERIESQMWGILNKLSSDKFLEYHLKGVAPEETEESFKRMSRHAHEPVKLEESRNKSKDEGQKNH